MHLLCDVTLIQYCESQVCCTTALSMPAGRLLYVVEAKTRRTEVCILMWGIPNVEVEAMGRFGVDYYCTFRDCNRV